MIFLIEAKLQNVDCISLYQQQHHKALAVKNWEINRL